LSFSLESVGLAHANGHVALTRVTLAARPGERLAIIGPSGAGKTTLIRVLGTSLRETQGRVTLLGSAPWQLNSASLKRLRARIGVVHQSAPIPPRLRVITAVLAGRLGAWSIGRALLSLMYPQDIAGARAALTRVELADKLFERCDRISGGQLQRVGVARVLYQEPDLVLADEPVSSLDPALADFTLEQLTKDATARGATLVASLHAVDLALKWFPRIVGVRAGQIAFDLPREHVSEALLRDLYSSEGALLPTQAASSFAAPLPLEAPLTAPQCKV
jgi:phosphonate transport system ATP-binding protein